MDVLCSFYFVTRCLETNDSQAGGGVDGAPGGGGGDVGDHQMMVMVICHCTLAAPRYFQNKFHIFDHRIPCEFLRNSFTPRIRFVGLILAKIEGVKL